MAITNTLVNNVCYPSLDAAKDAYFSQMPVSLVTSSTDTYRVDYRKPGSDWLQFKQVANSSGSISSVYSTVVNPPVFPACDATQAYFDGMTIGWGIVSAMVAVYAIIIIRKAFFAS